MALANGGSDEMALCKLTGAISYLIDTRQECMGVELMIFFSD